MNKDHLRRRLARMPATGLALSASTATSPPSGPRLFEGATTGRISSKVPNNSNTPKSAN